VLGASEELQVTADRHDLCHPAILPDGSKLPRDRSPNALPPRLSS